MIKQKLKYKTDKAISLFYQAYFKIFAEKQHNFFNSIVSKTIKGDNSSYQKFVIFTQPRCGSNLLTFTLKKHSNILMFSEIFNRSKVFIEDENFKPSDLKMLAIRNNNNLKFLEEVIFTNYKKSINAVGFKVFPSQIYYKKKSKVKDYLIENDAIKIVHLKRENLLDVYCSYLKAKKTNIYYAKGGNLNKVRMLKVKIDVNKFDAFIKEYELQNEFIKSSFKNHQVLKINYKNIISNYNVQLKNIFEFLNVKSEELKLPLKKIEQKSYKEKIINFEEVKIFLERNRLSKFLEE